MTRETLRASDPALAAALDRLEPPALPADFADRVFAAAQSRTRPELPRLRRRGLGLWTHGRRAVLASAVLVVGATAAAAATGLLERVGVDLQPVGEIVERVAAAVPGLAPAKAIPKPAPSVAPIEESAAQPQLAEAAPLDDPRRERLAQALAARIDRRIARADARGLAVPERLRQTELGLDPERAAARPEQAALVERVQQIRRERQQAATGAQAAPDPVTPEADLAQIAENWAALNWRQRIRLVRPLDQDERRRLFAMLTPEQRAELLQMRRQRREAGAGAEQF